jgi:hypothetical protein
LATTSSTCTIHTCAVPVVAALARLPHNRSSTPSVSTLIQGPPMQGCPWIALLSLRHSSAAVRRFSPLSHFFSSSLPSITDDSGLLRRQSVHVISPLPHLGMPPVLVNMHSELLLLEATLNTASPPFFATVLQLKYVIVLLLTFPHSTFFSTCSD